VIHTLVLRRLLSLLRVAE